MGNRQPLGRALRNVIVANVSSSLGDGIARVAAPLLAELQRLVAFAPLHLPSAIQGIEAVTARFPGLPQVACFDTAFHRRMPELAQRFPLPRDLWHEGIRRYGFHGLSYEYIVATLGAAAQGRVIIAHLGNGSSLAAVHHGIHRKQMERVLKEER